MSMTLPDFSFYVDSFRSLWCITSEQTDGQVNEKKDLNRACALGEKRVKIKKPIYKINTILTQPNSTLIERHVLLQ